MLCDVANEGDTRITKRCKKNCGNCKAEKSFKTHEQRCPLFAPMSFRNVLTVTNLVFLIGGVYFVIVSVLGEATIYTLFVAILCFISGLLPLREGLYFSGPWRVASAVAVLIVLAGQVAASLSSSNSDPYTVGTILLNGALFVIYFGVLMSSAREVTKQTSEAAEETEEEEAEETSAR